MKLTWLYTVFIVTFCVVVFGYLYTQRGEIKVPTVKNFEDKPRKRLIIDKNGNWTTPDGTPIPQNH
jgi:hypothetical protein